MSAGAAKDVTTPVTRSWTVMLVYVNITIYSMCYMAQVPILPYLTKKLGADAAGYGRLQSFFSFAQFLGTLVSGPMADRFGGKTMLIISFASSILSYWLTAVADSLFYLYLAKLASLLQHAILASRKVLVTITSPEDRARYLGYTTMAYGLGFAIGPAVGGWLSEVAGLYFVAQVAVIGSLISLVSVALFPDAEKAHREQAVADSPPTQPALDGSPVKGGSPAAATQDGAAASPSTRPGGGRVVDLLHVLALPGVWQLLLVKLLANMAGSLFQSTFSLMLQAQFGLSSKDNGMVLSYVGVLTMLSQGLLVSRATRHFSDAALVKAAALGLTLSYAGMSCATSVVQLTVLLLPMSAAGSLVSTINTAQLTRAVPPSMAGSVMALDMAIFSGVRMASPTIGTSLATSFGYPSISVAAASCSGLLAALTVSGLLPADVSQLHAKMD